MPLIRVTHASPLSTDVVEKLLGALTSTYCEVTASDPAAVHVLLDQVPPDRWGVGGESLTARRSRS